MQKMEKFLRIIFLLSKSLWIWLEHSNLANIKRIQIYAPEKLKMYSREVEAIWNMWYNAETKTPREVQRQFETG